jgi:hypothetical protein
MMKLILPKPPMGAFELAVANFSSFPRLSKLLSFTNFQKFTILDLIIDWLL